MRSSHFCFHGSAKKVVKKSNGILRDKNCEKYKTLKLRRGKHQKPKLERIYTVCNVKTQFKVLFSYRYGKGKIEIKRS